MGAVRLIYLPLGRYVNKFRELLMPGQHRRTEMFIRYIATTLVVLVLRVPSGLADDRTTSSSTTFESDIQPLLTRLGCNAGACHGKSRGQNGFALSLLGFDSDFDYSALANEGRGRRVFPSAAEESLLVRKAVGQVPHGGGKRLEIGSPPYKEILAWIRNGLPPHTVGCTKACSSDD